jgi:valyl-tRNA synthetase
MSHELPKAYDPSVIEERWAEYWVRERLFDVPTPQSQPSLSAEDTRDTTKKFTMLLPPPNVTGRLHMGHMLNQTEMDILTRWHRMLGDLAVWIPGTDHAGIATQMMVERQLATEGTSRKDLGREAFVQRVWCWRKLYGGAILDQMKRLGASVDWSREYFTMDDRLSVAVKEAFVRLYEQGLIYRGTYIVNWDPQIQTAISDLEVESEERVGKIYHIRYPLADGSGSIVIATTRPETMLGDTAVAVNPDDTRYQHLIGKELVLPLQYRTIDSHGDTPLSKDDFVDGDFVMRRIPIIADAWANPEFGTGAVKVTPAHDQNDFEIGKRHNLPIIDVMDATARINANGGIYSGLDRFEARERIVENLRVSGALVEIKDHSLTLPISQRTGVVVEKRLSQQWFLAVNKTPNTGGNSIAQNAIDAVREKHINFTPEMYKKIYLEWMNNIYDWCISRQLWWGHRIPAWHCADCGGITVARDTPTHCGACNSANIAQETDVLDTWFSSGLLPFTTLGWPNAGADGASQITNDLAAFYPTSLLVTGFDILFFWVARMIMLGCHFMLDVPMPDGSKRTLADAVPFKEVYIHGLVRDADRQKMSKTKGNVINPIDIIERFGTDAVRFTLASMASPGTDIAFSEARTEGYRAFANKIWNAARFLFMNIDRAKEVGISIDLQRLPDIYVHVSGTSALEDRWIVGRLSALVMQVNRELNDYRFDLAAQSVYQFFWNDFCDWYLELVKLRLIFEPSSDLQSARTALTSIVVVFENLLRLLSPFMPFITEELWHALYRQEPPHPSIALAPFPQEKGNYLFSDAWWSIVVLQNFATEIRALRKDLGVPEKDWVDCIVYVDPINGMSLLGEVQNRPKLYAHFGKLNRILFSQTPLRGGNIRSAKNYDVAIIYERQIDIPAERERLAKDLAKYEKGLTAADRQLGNEAFMAKAPAHIVDGLRKQHAETKMLYDKTKAALDALGG